MRCLWSCNKWGSTLFNTKGQARTPPCVCCADVSAALLAEDAPRTVLHVGLHHSCHLHRGGSNPILFGVAVQACEEEEGTGSELWRSLPSTPPLSAECHPLPPSSVHSLLSEAGRRRTRLRDRRTALFTHRPSPRLSRLDTAELFPRFVCLLNAFTGGIYCVHVSPVTRPSMFTSETASDLPESITLPSHCQSHLPTTHAHLDFTDCHWKERKTHRVTRMGFYGTLKMIFYKVSTISACIRLPTHPRLFWFNVWLALSPSLSLTADCTATAEDEQQCSRPPETPL